MQASSAALMKTRYGQLTVVGPAGDGGARGPLWDCRCDCGGSTHASTGELVAGRTSCGCVMRKAFEENQASRRRRPLRPEDQQDDRADFTPPPAKPVDPAARAAYLFAPEATLWVIYASPKGYPDLFVLRRWVLDDGDPIPDAEPAAVEESLDAARAAMPEPGSRKQVKQSTGQDPTVVEVWR